MLGPPRRDIRADGPFGAAFGDDPVTLVGVNPTSSAVTVAFHLDGETVGEIGMGPSESAVEEVQG